MDLSNEVRDLLLDHNARIRALLPTAQQLKIIFYIESSGSVSSNMVAEAFGISINRASSALKRIWEAGHITRESTPDPTGGKLYMYSALNYRLRGASIAKESL